VEKEKNQEVEALAVVVVVAVPTMEEPAGHLSEGEYQSPLRSNKQPSTMHRLTMLPRPDSKNTN